MKKVVYIIFFSLILVSLNFPQSITVTKPVSGEEWQKNIPHFVEWTFTGEINEFVKIRLFNGDNSQKIMDIADQVASNNRRYQIPADFFNDIPIGTYTIRVKEVTNTFSGNSRPFFIGDAPRADLSVDHPELDTQPTTAELLRRKLKEINSPLPEASIKITYPDKNTNWRLKLGNTALPFPIRIQWEKSLVGQHADRVKIFLNRRVRDRYMRKTIILTSSTMNSGLFTGEIRRDLRSSIYSVTIKSLDGKLLAESQLFHITNAENDPN